MIAFLAAALALGGCGDSATAERGTAGTAGTGGTAGAGGGTGGTSEMSDCERPEDCDDGNECSAKQCINAVCVPKPLDDGTACTEGECQQGVCTPTPKFACTEQGIRDAIAEGGGPHFFACDGPTTVQTEAEIVIDNDVILDGEGELKVDGNRGHGVFRVEATITAELRGITVTGGASSGVENYGTLKLTKSTVSGNTERYGGGGIFNGNSGRMTVMNSTVSRNTAQSAGGGINNLGTMMLINSEVSGNSAVSISEESGDGGGIKNHGTLEVTNTTVSGNTAVRWGGGIANGDPDGLGTPTLTLTKSTVSGNMAQFGGGGIYNSDTGTITVKSSTVSTNQAEVAGGGIYNIGEQVITNSTVSRNRAQEPGGGHSIFNSGALTLTNTLIETDPLVVVPSCVRSAPIGSGGGNLESPGNTCGLSAPADQVNVNSTAVKLGPLADNGGPTMTHMPMPFSVAINKIDAAACKAATDQRGEPRPETGGTMCDVGSFEVPRIDCNDDNQCPNDENPCTTGPTCTANWCAPVTNLPMATPCPGFGTCNGQGFCNSPL